MSIRRTVNHPTTPEEKKKALDTAMEQIIKNYGQGAVMFLGGEGNKKLDVESVPTGSTIFPFHIQ